MNDYEQKILTGWEDIHKKSQLTLWILLALKDGPKHMTEIKQFIKKITNNTISADDKSMYRALRRYDKASLIVYVKAPSSSGPDRKVYRLTHSGITVLEAFIDKNVNEVFLSHAALKLFKP